MNIVINIFITIIFRWVRFRINIAFKSFIFNMKNWGFVFVTGGKSKPFGGRLSVSSMTKNKPGRDVKDVVTTINTKVSGDQELFIRVARPTHQNMYQKKS